MIVPDGQRRAPEQLAVRIRKAEVADAAGIARVYVDSWRETYTGILPTRYLANLSYNERQRSWARFLAMPGYATFVAESARHGVIGFAQAGPARSCKTGHFFAELYVLYLLADYQRQGIGTKLVAASAKALSNIGLRSMLVWVLADNPARRFYEALGGELIGEKPVDIDGTRLIEVAYGWRDNKVLTTGD